MAKFELMLKPTFILVGIGTFLIHLGYFVPLFYIPDMAVSMGVERTKANFLLSIFGEFKGDPVQILILKNNSQFNYISHSWTPNVSITFNESEKAKIKKYISIIIAF